MQSHPAFTALLTLVVEFYQGTLTVIRTLPHPGLNWYYARILQEDGEVTWSSPVWVVTDGK